MTVHSPPSTSLGTRRSDESMGLAFLEDSQVFLEKHLIVHSPQTQVLGQGEVMFC